MPEDFSVSDMYIEYRPQQGPAYIRHHRVWDRDKFLASQVAGYAGPLVKPEDRCIVAVSDRDAYLRQQRAGR